MNFVGQFIFVSWHGRLLQAHTDGEMHASQDVANAGDEERWNVFAWPDGKVSLQNLRTNLWLCGEASGQAICNRPAPAELEQWTMYSAGDSVHINLQSHSSLWLCAQPPGNNTRWGGEVCADRPNRAEWERFSMIPSAGIPVHNQSWWNDVRTGVEVAGQVLPILIGG
jgi:hypothetical protein